MRILDWGFNRQIFGLGSKASHSIVFLLIILMVIIIERLVSYLKTLAVMESQGLFCCCILDQTLQTVERFF